jgi:hypothetical protein
MKSIKNVNNNNNNNNIPIENRDITRMNNDINRGITRMNITKNDINRVAPDITNKNL